MNRPRLVFPPGFAVLLSAVALGSCAAPPQTAQARADAATRTACETRANQAYDQQNRAAIYSPQSQVNTPYSASYLPDDTNRGLSDLFAHDRMVSDCIRNTGTGTQRSVPQAATPSPPQPK